MRRLTIVLTAAALLAVPAARADGDPASDVLYFQDTFVSFEEFSKPVISKLEQAAAKARAQGRPIKVAVIWKETDMGAVPLLFNKPETYAKFLAAELGEILTGSLVIAMPAGWGLYMKKGNRVAAARALAHVPFHADTVDELTETATAGVNKLRLSLTRPKGDARSPAVHAIARSAKLGKQTQLRFRISDNSGRAKALVRVYGQQLALFASIPMSLRKVRKRGSIQHVSWRPPVTLGTGGFQFCVLATDRAGNSSKTSCAKLVLKKG